MTKQTFRRIGKIAIILIILILIILLLLCGKNRYWLKQNDLQLAEEKDDIMGEANAPILSAGMIPIKKSEIGWKITSKEDWYNYAQGKPAYVMLNDGTYQSEILVDMKNKKLVSDNIGTISTEDKLGKIFVWIPRYEQKEEKIKYISVATQTGENWEVPNTFMYLLEDETKPDFSLSGIWVEINEDVNYLSTIEEMNKENGKYGFIKNNKPRRIELNDIEVIKTYIEKVGNILNIENLESTNRIILQIVNTKQVEPIKAKGKYISEENKIQIEVTYSANGIEKIIDKYSNELTITNTNPLIAELEKPADEINNITIIDTAGNKKEIKIKAVCTMFAVAYNNGTDNMTNEYIYNNNTLNMENGTYDIDLEDGIKTRIELMDRTESDTQYYIWSQYNATLSTKYVWELERTDSAISATGNYRSGWENVKLDESSGNIEWSVPKGYTRASLDTVNTGIKRVVVYTYNNSLFGNVNVSKQTTGSDHYYKWSNYNSTAKTATREYYVRKGPEKAYTMGSLESYVFGLYEAYTIGSSAEIHSDGYWYIRGSLAPRYMLHKYQNEELQSTYDVDTATMVTKPIDISARKNRKVKLTINATDGLDKVYISNDRENWELVTEIISGEEMILDVRNWDTLYIKLEYARNVNNIEVKY